MKVGRTLYVHRVADWRAWLRKHHTTRREVWLVYYNKASGRPRISYNDAVEEALCFGWIDSQAAKLDADRSAQRFTPRRPGSPVSEMNRARVHRLVRERRMTRAGLEAIGSLRPTRLVIRADIKAALQREPLAWTRFQRFPIAYRRMRVRRGRAAASGRIQAAARASRAAQREERAIRDGPGVGQSNPYL